MAKLRVDYDILKNWTRNGERVLDLGCGDGAQLKKLCEARDVTGLGLENDPEKITRCLEAGLDVIEHDLDQGLNNFQDRSFDTVIMAYTLQAVRFPERLLREMLRVGRQGVVTLPNYGHWLLRASLLLRGRMPRSQMVPYEWHDGRNFHLCTIDDFERLCASLNIRMLDRVVLSGSGAAASWQQLNPNLLASAAVYRLALESDR